MNAPKNFGKGGSVQTEPNGLIYMRGRFYSPAWHRFLNSDQGADPNQMNQFAYCGGIPMMGTDPSGMMVVFAGGTWQQGCAATGDPTAGPMSDLQNAADLWQTGLPGWSGSVSIFAPFTNSIHDFLANATAKLLDPVWVPGSSVQVLDGKGNVSSENSEPGHWDTGDGAAAQTGQSDWRQNLLTDMLAGQGTAYGHQQPQLPNVRFDCSGFVKWAFGNEGISFDGSGATSGATNIINSSNVSPTGSPQPGDLVYWGNPPHIMIYTGGNQAYGASKPGVSVTTRTIWGNPSYYAVTP